MSNKAIIPVIIAGGTGSRLWPISREMKPKQFLSLNNNGLTLLQETIRRAESLTTNKPYIICNEQHRFLVAEQTRQLGIESPEIILEPVSRNTAPAIAIAAIHAEALGEDPVILVLSADHYIKDTNSFQGSVDTALPMAASGKLVIFGVAPSYPESGYGYIEKGAVLANECYSVKRFIEKPDSMTAQKLASDKNYFWNSGVFMFRAKKYLEILNELQPDIYSCCQDAYKNSKSDSHFIKLDSRAFFECPDKSIDYAVMEHTSDAAMVPLKSGWSDIGSWKALWEIHDKDKNGNVFKGDVIGENINNCYIRSDNRLIAAIGVKDLIIVETKDAILVANIDDSQNVKDIVKTIKNTNRSEHINHREVYRPWGVYDSIDTGRRYQVKRITVNPGAKLSVQMHHHRAEHWIVVSGTAKVTNAENTYLVTENQSTYIPVGQVHALENPGVIPLELIEVQSGSYLGEDDIVRFEDKYGRT